MSGIYLLRIVGQCTEVFDSRTGDANTATTVFGPSDWDSANRYAAKENLKPSDTEPPRPAPCCDCTATVERYRHALAQIARHTDCEYARRTADDALAGDD